MPSNGFVNLHNHSDYSILDGYSHPGEYVKRAAELGQTAVGLTDHGNLFGAFDFIKSARAMAKSYDRKNHPQTPVFIKPIIGIEAYMAPQNPDGAKCKSPVFYSPELKSIIERRKELGYNSRKKVEGLVGEELQIFKDMEARERELRGMDVSSRGAYTHLTLIAINDVGFHNLIHLTTEASKREHYYQHGRMDFDMLTRWNEGIIATTGCPSGEIQTRLRLGQVDEAYDYARRMAELFDGRYYVELMLHNMPSDLESSMIPKLKKLADDLDLPLLATNDSHYARPEDSIHHEEMLCVQTNSRGGGVGAKGFVTMNCLKNDDPAPDRMISVKQRDGSYKEVPQPRRFAFQGDDYYLKTYDEMIKAFPEDKFPGAVSNTVKIADMVGDWWIKDGALDIDALEESYRKELEAVRGEAIDADGAVTLPHATGGRTSSVEVSGKGLTALGSTTDATDVEDGFHVDALTQRLVDDGKIAIGPYDLSLNTDLRPEIQIPEGWTEEEWFKKKINEGFVQRRVAMGDSDEILEDSKRRIADEFPVFAGKNFIQYMLVVQDYINWAREHGVSVGEGRGCFLPDSMVTLENGETKSIQDVKSGDYVLTNNGSSQKVIEPFKYHVRNEDCVEVGLSNSKTIRCTADHMLYVDKVGFVKACDLKPGLTLSGRMSINGVPEDSDYDHEEHGDQDPPDGMSTHSDATNGLDALTPYLNGETLGGINLNNGASLSLKHPEDPSFVEYDSWTQLRMINLLEMSSDVRSYSRLGGAKWSTGADGRSGLHGALPMFLVSFDDGTEDGSTRVIALSEEADTCPAYQEGLDWAKSRGLQVEEWSLHDIESIERHHRSYTSVVSVDHFAYDGHVYDLHVDKVHNYTIEGVTVHNSVGGSEIAYLMDISRTDPVRHDLLFERFLNPERNSPPDVDTDFKASVRNRVLQYAKDKYGYDKVANIITFGTFQFKQAFRDVAKIYQMTNAEVDCISKLIPEPIDRVAPTMHDLYDPESPFYAGAAEFREVIASNDEWKPIIESTDKISGRVRQTGTHACGVIMSSKPISDYAPLFWTPDEKKAKSNIWTDCMVGWEYPDLESIGLIKMDFLPLSTLDLIDDTIDNIKSYNDTVEELAKELEAEGDVKAAEAEESRKLPVPNLDNIEVHGLEDAETFKTLANGDSDAVFQLGSDGQKALLKRIEPDRFEDIVAINALYRPGPMGMNAHLEYADRKNGRAPAYIIDEKLDKVFRGTPVADVLGPTYGLCVPAGTPILDCTTGKYVPIEEFPIGHKTISFNEETNEWSNNEVSDVFHTGKHDIVRITTRNHKVIEVANTHPLLTQRGWVRAGELLESDSLVMSDGGMDEIPNGSGLTSDLLKELDRSYSPITSTQVVGERECWDMTVENDHTYMINGFVGHNCIYQESVMQISRLLCGFTRGQADSLRKAIGHKIPEEMEANHKRFVDGAMRLKEENGWIFNRSDVEALWSYIEKFASYGFNRSHSVSYAIDAYKTAYLKTHYYPFFMASCMTADLNNKDKFAVYLRNVEDRGLKVGPVNVNHSNKGIQAVAKKSPDDPDIVFGFDKATGVNADLADEITRTREKTLKGEFKSFDEFMMNMESLNAGALTGLANAGAFDDFGIPRKAIAKNAKDLIEFYRKKRASKTKISGSLFGMMGGSAGYDAVGDYDFKLTGDPTRDEYPLTSKLKAEKDSLSVYVSASPASNAGAGLDVITRTPYYWRASTVEDVTKLISENTGDGKRFFRKEVRMVGWFSDLTYKKYRSGTGVFFIGTFSDKTGNLGVSVNGGLAEQMAAAVGLRPMDDNPLSGRFPVSAFYKSGELNTVRKGNAKPTVDEQVERLTDVLVDVTVQITNDRVKVKSLSLVPTTPDGRVPLTLRLRTERGASNRKFLQVIEIMKSHPGDVPVVVDIKEVVDHSSKPTLMGVPLQVGPNNVLPFGVDLSEEMINEVSKLRDPEDFFMSWATYEASAAYDPVHQG